jgi:hypothetical protein
MCSPGILNEKARCIDKVSKASVLYKVERLIDVEKAVEEKVLEIRMQIHFLICLV